MRTRVMARLGLALLAVLALAQAPRAKAANPIVTSCGDDTQLDQALLVGGTITFNCGPGNYTIPISSTKTIPTGAAIKIDGGSRGKITLSGGAARQILVIQSGAAVELDNLVFSRGSGTTGGAIDNRGTLSVTASGFDGNASGLGGAILNTRLLTVTNSIFTNNTIKLPFSGSGGAIYNEGGGRATITATTFYSNTATAGGGAISSYGTMTITATTLYSNTAPTGGAIYNGCCVGGGLQIVNSTFSRNTATSTSTSFGGGGGLYNADSNQLVTVLNSTFYQNVAGVNGGSVNGKVQVTNTILDQGAPANCGDAVTSQGYNLESGTDCGFHAVGDRQSGSALLGPLQNNGGPTLTHMPRPGSAAIDAASGCPPVDQRGFDRPIDGDSNGIAACDIGAVERNLFVYLPLTWR